MFDFIPSIIYFIPIEFVGKYATGAFEVIQWQRETVSVKRTLKRAF